jgi:PKD repeat protein
VYELKKIIKMLMFMLFLFSALASVYVSPVLAAENSTIVADFSAVPVSGVAPLTVQFEDTSSGNPTARNWDFNSDGKVDSTTKTPVYQFTKPGIYDVTLNVSNGATRDSITKIHYINVGIKPVAGFTASPGEGRTPLTVQFADTSAGNPTSWLWSFGDGITSTSQSPIHTYYGVGTYKVILTVSNTFGSNTLESNSLINVSSTPTSIADFNSNVTSGKAPLTVQFYDLTTGSPAAWEWDFNSDGQVDSNEKNPVYEFKDLGTYTVSLRAGSGAAWGTIAKTNYITVGNGLQAAFAISPGQGQAPLTVQFTDTSIGAPTAWLWDFGDGNISTFQNPAHVYSQAGNYTVKLAVSDTIQQFPF